MTACPPWSGDAVAFSDSDTSLADMNGDGLPDIVRVRNQDIRYWPGRGQGLWGTGTPESCPADSLAQDRSIAMTGGEPTVNAAYPVQLSDVNGDGLADLVQPFYGGVQVWLNVDGTALTASPYTINGAFSSQIDNELRILDINGSGTPDLVWGNGGAYQYIDLQGGQRPWLLTSIQNGLGSTKRITYTSSAQLMLQASQHTPWASVMPLVMPVVTAVVDQDNLSTGALGVGQYESDYTYRDPSYDGQRRVFNGFASATVTHVGDADEPTNIESSTLLQGQCVSHPADGLDVCAPSERWRDNPRSALSGLVQVKTYPGRDRDHIFDGAFVVCARSPLLGGRWTGRSSGIPEWARRVDLRDVTVHAWCRVCERRRPGRQYGVRRSDVARGVAPEHFIRAPVEHATRRHLRRHRVGDGRGVRGRIGLQLGGRDHHEHDCVQSAGRRRDRMAMASGPELRFRLLVAGNAPPPSLSHVRHGWAPVSSRSAALGQPAARPVNPSGGGVAAPPPAASVDGRIVTSTFSSDGYGNLTGSVGADGHCRTVQFDTSFALLPVHETIFAGAVSGSCGTTALTVTAEYDRGLDGITAEHGINGELTTVVYDGFGRLMQTSLPDPQAIGAASSVPSLLVDYALPGQSSDPAYSVVHTQVQDGVDPSVAAYRETWSFVDGMGRRRLQVETGDTPGSFVVSGFTSLDAKGKAIRSYQPWFWSGSPTSFPLRSFAPTTAYTRRAYDPLGRPIASDGPDGVSQGRNVFHPLSVDTWDGEDLNVGPHQGTPTTVTTDGHGRTATQVERIHQGGSIETRAVSYSYLPTGEVTSIVRSRGSDAVVRWMMYDSLGRLLLNADPDASSGFTPDPGNLSQIHAVRYAYDDGGDLRRNQ